MASGGAAADKADKLTIIHFNDVYNIEPSDKDPVGGAARFVTKLREVRDRTGADRTLVVFSGDAFNPSLISTVSKGAQMVPCLNACGIDAAVYGNHEWDHGQARLAELVADCNFPWLMSNADCNLTGGKLGGGLTKLVVERGGRRIGFVGLIEKAWLATLATIDPEDVEYEDFVTCGLRLANELRAVDKVDLVVAITHMRMPNDRRLAAEAGGVIDIILGGHDHAVVLESVGGALIVKSGTDFKDLSEILVEFWPEDEADASAGGKAVRATFDVVRHTVTKDVAEDTEVKAVVEKFLADLEHLLGETVGETAVPLDARFACVRTHETNIGNFVADAILDACQGDVAPAHCVLLNSGTLRADRVLDPGPVTHLDLQVLMPLMDELCIVALTGEQLVAALENGVSKWPALEGRFPQVAGLKFEFDPAQRPGSRVNAGTVEVAGRPLKPDERYNVAAKAFIGRLGKDGYDVFREGEVVVDEEDLLPVPSIVANRFSVLELINERHGASLERMTTPARTKSVSHFRETLFAFPPLDTPVERTQSVTAERWLAVGAGDGKRRSLSVGGVPVGYVGGPGGGATGGGAGSAGDNDRSDSADVFSPSPEIVQPMKDPFASPPRTPQHSGGDSGGADASGVSVGIEVDENAHFAIRPVVEGRIRCTATELCFISDVADMYDGFILDQYGVLHNGAQPLPGVVRCLKALLAAGKAIVINSNTSQSADDTRRNLMEKHGLGVLSDAVVVTSGSLMLTALDSAWRGKRCLLFGWTHPRPDLKAFDLVFTADPADADFLLAGGPSGVTDADGNVLVASDFEKTGELGALDPLLRTAVRRGLVMLVANNDRISRTADGGTAFRPGLLADRYDNYGGTTLRFGKPGVPIFEESVARLAERGVTDRSRICHVGDSLHHDVSGASAAGLAAVFVTGGVHAETMGITPGDEPPSTAVSVLCATHKMWPTRTIPSFAWD